MISALSNRYVSVTIVIYTVKYFKPTLLSDGAIMS